MTELHFVNQHNMVAMLSKVQGSDKFHEILDFLRTSYISYALTVNPKIYVEQMEKFWVNATVDESEGGKQIKSVVCGKSIGITEANIRTHLHLNDAARISSLPNETLFGELKNMGYEGSLDKFTFYKDSSHPMEIFDSYNPTITTRNLGNSSDIGNSSDNRKKHTRCRCYCLCRC